MKKNDILRAGGVCALSILLMTGCGEKKEDTKSNSNSNSNQAVESNSNVQYSSNSNPTSNSVEDKNVVKVSVDSKQINKEYFEIFVNATNKSGKTVWKRDLGKIPYGTGVYSLGGEQGSKYFYLTSAGKFQALDIQTGKVVWSTDKQLDAATIIEAGDKIFVREGMGTNNIVFFDINTGKVLNEMNDIQEKYLARHNPPIEDYYDYYDLDSSKISYNNGEVIIDVRDRDDSGNDAGKVGYLKINTSTYAVEFVKTK